MNIRILAFIWFCILLFYNSFYISNAQSLDYIRKSGEYYHGIGTGRNYQAARRNALENLSESISVSIKSEFEQVVKETNDDLEIYTESVVSTYSSAVVNYYEERVLKEEPDHVEVLVYISKPAMQEAFRQRELVIHDFIYLANKAREELRIADALRYYYWALVLTRSHPDNMKLTHKFEGDRELPVMLTLNDRIRSIFSFLNVEIISIEERREPFQKHIYLSILYHGQPVQDLDYIYWLGDGYSGLHSASNGMGFALLEGVVARDFNTLRLRVEYQYANKAHLEPEIQMMVESVELPYFERAEIRVDLSAGRHIADIDLKRTTKAITEAGRFTPEFITHTRTVTKVVDAIKDGAHSEVGPLFTSEGYDIYNRLIASGNVTVLDSHFDTLRIIRVGNEVMARSVPMMFSYHNNREKFIENVVFTFNQEDRINGISFALSDIAINDILSKPGGFGEEEEKYFLIKFMEDFKTAYSAMRLDYLDAIFDENALIIVGNVLRRSAEPVEKVKGLYGNLSNEQIDYVRLSKHEYMERLRNVFRRNEFINIRFEDNQVRKTQREDKIYGIQIAQHYYSSTYADKGYLFLMLDLNDTLNPKIYVRTWQPEKNPDGSIFGLEDFRF